MASLMGSEIPKAIKFTASYDWTDITKDFWESAKELSLGELIHDENFGLFEAMSAIEMMDPKMDAGMLCNRASKDRALSYEEAVKVLIENPSQQRNKIKLTELTPSECIGIIDGTFACLVTWLEGHSLAQTVFTNLYLHRPFETSDVVMRGFSLTILKLIDLLINFVTRQVPMASVFEEEDFQAMTYGFGLCNEIPIHKASLFLKDAEDFVGKAKGDRASEDLNEIRLLDALAARLRFTRIFYQVFVALGKRECSGLSQAIKASALCADIGQSLKDSICLGSQPETNQSFPESRVDYPTVMGFEPLVNQRLLPPTFPRFTRIVPRDVAYDRLTSLMNRLKTISGVSPNSSFPASLDFISEFSAQSPCVVSRSVMKLTFLPQGTELFGLHQLTEVLRDACRDFISPPILTNKAFSQAHPEVYFNNIVTRESVNTFFCVCSRPFTFLIQALSHNRARLRDRLGHLLEDFAALQDEADRVDQLLNSLWNQTYGDQTPGGSHTHLACLGTWILHHTLKIMVTFLLTGFELELYSVHEYHYIFWYLHEFLYGWVVSAFTRAEILVMEQDKFLEKQILQNQKGKSGKKSSKSKRRRTKPYEKEIHFNQALQDLCGGYYKVMKGLKLEGKIDQPFDEFDSEKVRYEHRFGPFAAVTTPPVVSYEQFIHMTSILNAQGEKPTARELYMDASRFFGQAKTILESLQGFKSEQVMSLVQVAKTNFVVSKLLANGHQKDSSSPILFDFSLHSHFPVMKFS
ncbi:unnamed protein product [Notodromas monacha]|uniref:Protein MAK10 homolog n=1 Tax=Notodromas monacha TaxID=399045 RepID=A0A7R9BJE8_9CRUS|nr:unnamed protein product [Notodromas monacha]CAG0915848.1 unnamed protein product [Notodromas monacha]